MSSNAGSLESAKMVPCVQLPPRRMRNSCRHAAAKETADGPESASAEHREVSAHLFRDTQNGGCQVAGHLVGNRFNASGPQDRHASVSRSSNVASRLRTSALALGRRDLRRTISTLVSEKPGTATQRCHAGWRPGECPRRGEVRRGGV